MKSFFKYLGFLCTLLSGISAFSQQVTVHSPFEFRDFPEPPELIAADEFGLIFMAAEPEVGVFIRTTPSWNEKFRVALSADGRFSKLAHVEATSDTTRIWAFFKERSKITLRKWTVNEYGKNLDSVRLIQSWSIDGKTDIKRLNSVLASKSKFLFLEETKKSFVGTFVQVGSAIQASELKLPEEEGWNYMSFAFDGRKNQLMFLNHKLKNLPTKGLIFLIEGDVLEQRAFQDSANYITQLYFTGNDSVVLYTGLYGKKNTESAKGFIQLVFRDTLASTEIPFPDGFLQKLLGKRESLDGNGLANVKFVKLIGRTDSTIAIACELNYTTTEIVSTYNQGFRFERTLTYYHSDDAFIVTLSPNGKWIMHQQVPKSQISLADPAMVGTAWMLLDDQLVGYFNEQASYKGKIMSVSVQPNGKVKTTVLIDQAAKNTVILAGMAVQLSERTLIVPVQKRKGYGYLKLTF